MCCVLCFVCLCCAFVTDCCSLRGVGWHLFVFDVCSLLIVARWLLLVVCRLLFGVCRLVCVGCGLLLGVWYVMCVVCRVPFFFSVLCVVCLLLLSDV